MRKLIFLLPVLMLLALPVAWAGSVRLAWNASAGASGYKMHYGPGSMTIDKSSMLAMRPQLTWLG
jgi:hypothetical protein